MAAQIQIQSTLARGSRLAARGSRTYYNIIAHFSRAGKLEFNFSGFVKAFEEAAKPFAGTGGEFDGAANELEVAVSELVAAVEALDAAVSLVDAIGKVFALSGREAEFSTLQKVTVCKIKPRMDTNKHE